MSASKSKPAPASAPSALGGLALGSDAKAAHLKREAAMRAMRGGIANGGATEFELLKEEATGMLRPELREKVMNTMWHGRLKLP